MEVTLEQAKTKWCPLSLVGDWNTCVGDRCMAFTPAGNYIDYDEHNQAHKTPVFVCGMVVRKQINHD